MVGHAGRGFAGGDLRRRGGLKDAAMRLTPKSTREKGRVDFSALLRLTVVTLSAVLMLLLLAAMVQNVGNPGTSARTAAANPAIMDRFDMFVTNQVSDALDGVLSVKKTYWLSDDTQVAPEPDQSCYGEAADPAELQWLLDEAADLLDGQELYFSTETELFTGSKVQYYLDETILAITWKEVHQNCVYTFSEVKLGHPSQFRRHLAGGEYGAEKQFTTTEMASSVNAVVASSGDFYRFRDFGIIVYDGVARRVEGTYAETCYIDTNGDMHFTYAGEILDLETAQAYVDEKNIAFSLAFGPVLVDDYEIVEHTWYGVGEIRDKYARAALCQMDALHYIVATANTEGPHQGIPTVATFTKYIAATGCRFAYCLDGGQTAVIVMNDQLINRPVYGEQRKISDIIYFATAVPNGG